LVAPTRWILYNCIYIYVIIIIIIIIIIMIIMIYDDYDYYYDYIYILFILWPIGMFGHGIYIITCFSGEMNQPLKLQSWTCKGWNFELNQFRVDLASMRRWTIQKIHTTAMGQFQLTQLVPWRLVDGRSGNSCMHREERNLHPHIEEFCSFWCSKNP
jgi:hypothetical protein